jgi:DNA mismatch endonuclease, patch repair protein
MSRVKSRDTTPERTLRRMIHAEGYRYRLHQKTLPGKPDIVFAGRKRVIFVHGCFWHGHECGKGRLPKSNAAFWRAKVKANRARDSRHVKALEGLGWGVLTIWQCELKNLETVRNRIIDFLG